MAGLDMSDPNLSQGGGLEMAGIGALKTANTGFEAAAQSESERNQYNSKVEGANRAANQQVGSTVGAAAGSFFGPVGTALGGMAGGMIGGLFAIVLAVCLAVLLSFSIPSEKSMVTQLDLHQLFSYDPVCGHFTWIEGRNAGKRAGYLHKSSGYRILKLGDETIPEHRAAWLYMTGAMPVAELDHIDRAKTNNAFENLREATHKQNAENRGARAGSVSGFRGVSWSGGQWVATIMHFGKQVNLGSFDHIDRAKAARLEAEAKLFSHSNRSA